MDKLKGMLKISERDKKIITYSCSCIDSSACIFLWISESVFTGR